MPDFTLPENNKAELNNLIRTLAGSTDTQFRVSGSGTERTLSTKLESDHSSKSVKAFFSGQKKKFENAEAFVAEAFKRSTGSEPTETIRKHIANSVRGTNGQPIGEAMAQIRDIWAEELADQYSRKTNDLVDSVTKKVTPGGDVPQELQAEMRAALKNAADQYHADGSTWRIQDANSFAHRFITNHAKLSTVRSVANVDDAVTETMKLLRDTKLVASNNAFGTQVFNTIEKLNLPEDQKQEICCRIAEAIVSDECAKVKDGATLMRGNNASTNFLTAYMNKNTTEFDKAVSNSVKEGMSRIKMPEGGSKEIKEKLTIEVADPEMVASLKKGGNVIMDSIEKNRSKLSPNAQEMLGRIYKASTESMNKLGKNDQALTASRTAINSTLLLRCAFGSLSKEAQKMQGAQLTKTQGTYLLTCTASAQTFCNRLDNKDFKIDKNYDHVAKAMRQDEGSVARTQKLLDDIGSGVQVKQTHKVGEDSGLSKKGEGVKTQNVSQTKKVEGLSGDVTSLRNKFEKEGVIIGVKTPVNKTPTPGNKFKG